MDMTATIGPGGLVTINADGEIYSIPSYAGTTKPDTAAHGDELTDAIKALERAFFPASRYDGANGFSEVDEAVNRTVNEFDVLLSNSFSPGCTVIGDVCREFGIFQKAIAKTCGVTEQTVSGWKKSPEKIQRDARLRIAVFTAGAIAQRDGVNEDEAEHRAAIFLANYIEGGERLAAAYRCDDKRFKAAFASLMLDERGVDQVLSAAIAALYRRGGVYALMAQMLQESTGTC